jgi:LysM repeat protein
MVGTLWISPAHADVYVVQSGDALSTLARRFNVTVEQIREWNDLDGDLIRVGQELTIHPGSAGWQVYTVATGDTVARIADRYEVTVEDIVSWNRGLNPDRIRVGQELRIQGNGRPVRRILYEVQPGDFLARVARRHGVTIDDIVRWNGGFDPDRIRIGQELVLYVEGPERLSESVGSANRGRLVNGEQLPRHRAYRIRDRDRAWGTNETINYLIEGFDAVRRANRRAPRVMIHDLSDQDGGFLRGHRSHQSGRDADIGYYQVRSNCPDNVCPFEDVDADDLDVETEWTLLRHWIRNERVQYIFIDYSLQEALYEYARSQGASRRQLDEWFQYPHGRRSARGIIRHEPNHADHMHVRFACSDDDDECR